MTQRWHRDVAVETIRRDVEEEHAKPALIPTTHGVRCVAGDVDVENGMRRLQQRRGVLEHLDEGDQAVRDDREVQDAKLSDRHGSAPSWLSADRGRRRRCSSWRAASEGMTGG